MNGALVVVALPGGGAAALSVEEVAAAKRRALELGFGAAEPAAVAPSSSEAERMLTANELSKLLGVGKKRLEAMGRRGDIPSVVIGVKSRRYSLADVRAALEKKSS